MRNATPSRRRRNEQVQSRLEAYHMGNVLVSLVWNVAERLQRDTCAQLQVSQAEGGKEVKRKSGCKVVLWDCHGNERSLLWVA